MSVAIDGEEYPITTNAPDGAQIDSLKGEVIWRGMTGQITEEGIFGDESEEWRAFIVKWPQPINGKWFHPFTVQTRKGTIQ